MEYSSFQDAQRRESWRRALYSQVVTWRSRAIEAIGLSSTIGVAVGGVVATAAGAAASLAQGAVRGAVEVVSTSRPSLPPPSAVPAIEDAPPPPVLSSVDRPRLKRSSSMEVLAGNARDNCVACWTANVGHGSHLYRGNCQVIPGRLLWPPLQSSASRHEPRQSLAALSQPPLEPSG